MEQTQRQQVRSKGRILASAIKYTSSYLSVLLVRKSSTSSLTLFIVPYSDRKERLSASGEVMQFFLLRIKEKAGCRRSLVFLWNVGIAAGAVWIGK